MDTLIDLTDYYGHNSNFQNLSVSFPSVSMNESELDLFPSNMAAGLWNKKIIYIYRNLDWISMS